MDTKRRSSTKYNDQLNKGLVDFPPEIISHILSKLPVESILICRAVCKTWSGLTQETSFINKLRDSHYQPTRLILKPPVEKVIADAPSHLILLDIEECKTRRIPIDKMLTSLKIMCSYNGLLCMGTPLGVRLDPMVIYNPITRERVILPSPNPKFGIHSLGVGLGFDRSKNQYKVVRAYYYRRTSNSLNHGRKIETISLGENSWRELSAPNAMFSRDGWGGLFWNGSLFWPAIEEHHKVVIQFDIAVEEFRVISFPEFFSSRHVSQGFIDAGGYLTLIQRYNSIIKVWRLRENEDGGLSFHLQGKHNTHVDWCQELQCAFVCQMNQGRSYLLQIGTVVRWPDKPKEHLTEYFPEKVLYSNLKIPSLPDSFKSVCFKPCLGPLPAAASASASFHSQ